MTTKVLILGVNGFIGHHLSTRILNDTDWRVYGMDMCSERIAPLHGESAHAVLRGRHHYQPRVDRISHQKCDVVLPLVAIATPATYVREPLRVFELDFEANLPIIRQCVQLPQAGAVPLDLRGVRHVPRRRIRSPRVRNWCMARSRSSAGSTPAPSNCSIA